MNEYTILRTFEKGGSNLGMYYTKIPRDNRTLENTAQVKIK